MLELIQLPLLPSAAVLAALLFLLGRRGTNPWRLFCAFIFGVYLLLVLRGTLFPIPLPYDWRQSFTSNFDWILSQVNLIPFNPETLPLSLRTSVFQWAANVLLTVPFGFAINFVFPMRARWVPLLAVLPGLVIETAQLALTLLVGARYRVVDIDDVLMNTAGVLVGYILFRIFAWLWLVTMRLARAQPGGLAGYIQSVASQAQSRTRPPERGEQVL